MRKVIGIGETILDIIFKNNQPSKAVPGGSAFNAMLSLARLGVEVCYLSELGDDRVGHYIHHYMEQNGMPTEYLGVFSKGKSPLALAFLDEENNANYEFYTNYENNRFNVKWPTIQKDDIVIIGSYYALNPNVRDRVVEVLEYARERHAIIYYDPNFRKSHLHEVLKLMPNVLDNFEYADIVRGSDEDFMNLFALDSANMVYKEKVKFYTNHFIYTKGAQGVELHTLHHTIQVDAPRISAVSTIGAGDNFNAGFLYGLLKYEVTRDKLDHLSAEEWQKILQCGVDCASEVAQMYENSISKEFANDYKTR